MNFQLIPGAGSEETVPASGSGAIPGCSLVRNRQPDTGAVSGRFLIPVPVISYGKRIRVPFPAGSRYRFQWYITTTRYGCRFRQVPDTGFHDIWRQRRIRIISRCLWPVNKNTARGEVHSNHRENPWLITSAQTDGLHLYIGVNGRQKFICPGRGVGVRCI